MRRQAGLLTRIAGWLWCAGWLAWPGAGSVAGAESPNIILFLADDLGWGDLGCQGHPVIQTPHLDAFARQGVRLTQCYSASAVCSPSRSALLTGRTPHRNGVFTWIAEGAPVHLRPSEVTLPRLLREAGYATCHTGKWHLNGLFNDPRQPQPGEHGYDWWFATQNNADPSHANPRNFVRNGEAVGPLEGDSAHLVVGEAVRWLKTEWRRDRPFFLAVWTHEPHYPIQSAPRFRAMYPDVTDEVQREHHANVSQLDDAFGELLRGLEELRLTDNTCVVFTSDNGPEGDGIKSPGRGSTGGLRGRKRDLHEGGIRVPGLVRWPGQIAPGTVQQAPVIGSDLFATLLAVAGVAAPTDRVLDGVNVLPQWRGTVERVERPQPLYWRLEMAPNARVALREGDWKILANADRTRWELYHLGEDPRETTELSAREPERLAELKRRLLEHTAAVEEEGPDWWRRLNPNGGQPPKPPATPPVPGDGQSAPSSPAGKERKQPPEQPAQPAGKPPQKSSKSRAGKRAGKPAGQVTGQAAGPQGGPVGAGKRPGAKRGTRAVAEAGTRGQPATTDAETGTPRGTGPATVSAPVTGPVAAVASAGASGRRRPPNVVFILADDLGYTDLGCQGSRYYETPHIDRLAAAGLRFLNHHHCPNCTPTRAALMTGQSAPRTGVYTVGGIDRFHWQERPLRPVENVVQLPLDRQVIAQPLQRVGYATALFGKWHLGEQGPHHPGRRGFDEALVTMGQHYDFKTNPAVEVPPGVYLADFLTDKALDFIRRQQERPFFLYLPHFGVHAPHRAKPEWERRFQAKPGVGGHANPTYAAMIASVDESVGRILDLLEELHLADDTIVLFASDNGGVGGYVREGIKSAGDVTDNAPLRSGKGSLYEGGTRVPLIVRWPGVVAPGGQCDTPTIHVDLFPTLLEATGAPAPGQVLDGESLLPLWRDPTAPLRREAIFQHFPGYLGAGPGRWRTLPVSLVQQGDWKLLEFLEEGRLELYNLREDLGETRNLAEEQPERARAMQQRLHAWRKSVQAPMPTRNPNPEPRRGPQPQPGTGTDAADSQSSQPNTAHQRAERRRANSPGLSGGTRAATRGTAGVAPAGG